MHGHPSAFCVHLFPSMSSVWANNLKYGIHYCMFQLFQWHCHLHSSGASCTLCILVAILDAAAISAALNVDDLSIYFILSAIRTYRHYTVIASESIKSSACRPTKSSDVFTVELEQSWCGFTLPVHKHPTHTWLNFQGCRVCSQKKSANYEIKRFDGPNHCQHLIWYYLREQ